jgi:hypothetical protein
MARYRIMVDMRTTHRGELIVEARSYRDATHAAERAMRDGVAPYTMVWERIDDNDYYVWPGGELIEEEEG